jgi:hypothetical protein
MYVTTTKQLIDQSKCFRFLFWGSILLVCIGILLMIIFPFTSCSRPSYYSCSWYFPNYYNECTSYGVKYCCPSGYTYCGSGYCATKPLLYRACDAVIITGGSIMGVGFFLAIFVFVMFCNFRSKIKNAGYLGVQFLPPQGVYNPGQLAFNQPAQAYNPPVIIYSDQSYQQPQPQQQQQPQGQAGYSAPFQKINHSENE